MKIVCEQPKMPKLHCHQQKSLTYHFEINRLSLKFSGNNIVYRNMILGYSENDTGILHSTVFKRLKVFSVIPVRL